jgi:CheY-like chemotaxis protein
MLDLLNLIFAENAGYRVTCTSTSLEVPQILERERFDVVIADLNMPGMDGLDILRWIKSHCRDEQVVIMASTGSSDSETQALALGAFQYLLEPFKKDQIIEVVDQAVNCARERAGSTPGSVAVSTRAGCEG